MSGVSQALVVGDPHAVVEELGDCRNLAALILRSLEEFGLSNLILLGDQHHNHSTVRVEVTRFYQELLAACDRISVETLMLRGNHDMPHAGGSEGDALLSYDHLPRVTVVRGVLDSWDRLPGVSFAGYHADPKAFEEAVAGISGKTLVCHQTFSGATFENGFKCPDGVDPDKVPAESILSGHIHTPQKFGKVWYLGAPRWRTLSDANVERSLAVLGFDPEGRLVQSDAVDTGGSCRRILSFEDTLGQTIDLDSLALLDADQVRVTIKGPAAFCEKRLPLWKKLGARPQVVKTDRNKPTGEVRESEGLAQAFDKYLHRFIAPGGTPRGRLEALAKERIHV